MGVEQHFWKYLKEYGSMDFVELAYKGIQYQAVGDHGDGIYAIYIVNNQGDDVLVGGYPSMEDMMDKSVIADGLSLRQVFNRIELKDFLWF
ncbi:MAG: hypothetical protein BWY31_02591 [Lentisphaerae bacterium ADurb.Bin242]|nr:MAG: hypothetical protein BWY31_02591 [Lentisphaerae bacterium ADurb.Bin242]